MDRHRPFGTGSGERMVSRRRMLAGLGGAATLAFLAPGVATAAPGDPSGSSSFGGRQRGGRSTERLLVWTSESDLLRLEVIRYIAATYSAWTGRGAVEVVAIPERAFLTDLRQAVATGEPPDIVNTGGDTLLAADALGLLDRDRADEVVAGIGRERFFPAALTAVTGDARAGQGAKPAAVPFHGWPQILWWRSDLFAAAGLAPPSTLDAFETAAETLFRRGARGRGGGTGTDDPTPQQIGVVLGTDDSLYTQQGFVQIARACGASLFDRSGQPQLETPEMREAVERYRRLARWCLPYASNWRARDWYLQGRAGMMLYSTFIMDDLSLPEVAADSLTGGRFPGLDGAPFDGTLLRNTAMMPGVSAAAGTGTLSMINAVGIVRRPDRLRADPMRTALARQFVEFLYRPDSYVLWLHMVPGGMLPVLSGVADSDAFLRDPAGIFQRFGRDRIRSLTAALDTPEPGVFSFWGGRTVPGAATVYASGAVARMVRRVLQDGVSPAESLRQAQGEVTDALAGSLVGSD